MCNLRGLVKFLCNFFWAILSPLAQISQQDSFNVHLTHALQNLRSWISLVTLSEIHLLTVKTSQHRLSRCHLAFGRIVKTSGIILKHGIVVAIIPDRNITQAHGILTHDYLEWSTSKVEHNLANGTVNQINRNLDKLTLNLNSWRQIENNPWGIHIAMKHSIPTLSRLGTPFSKSLGSTSSWAESEEPTWHSKVYSWGLKVSVHKY